MLASPMIGPAWDWPHSHVQINHEHVTPTPTEPSSKMILERNKYLDGKCKGQNKV